jgi:hypothetical protein
MKLVTDLGENEVIHCPTIEEAEAICRLMDWAGLRWNGGDSYLQENDWRTHKKNTCYRPKRGTFTELKFFKENGYIIHKAPEFLTETK